MTLVRLHEADEGDSAEAFKRALIDFRDYWQIERALLGVEKATLEQVRRNLVAAHQATIERILSAVREWDIAQANEVLAELERNLDYWEEVTRQALEDAMTVSMNAGREQTVRTLRAGGIEIRVDPYINPNFLRVSIETLPVQITAVRRETIDKVARILRAAVLAQENPLDTIRSLGDIVPPATAQDPVRASRKTPPGAVPRPLTPYEMMRQMGGPLDFRVARPGERVIKSGPFKGLRPNDRGPVVARGAFVSAFHRAEAIVRTEMGRIAQQANWLTLGEVGRSVDGLMKEWNATLDQRTRYAHRAAHKQRVPWREPYVVGGEDMMYPNDPRGSAGNVINCRCVSLPWHPMFEEIEKDLGPGLSEIPYPEAKARVDAQFGPVTIEA